MPLQAPISPVLRIHGGLGDDTIRGGAGNDLLTGGAGNDRIIWNPGDGSDAINGNAGVDVVEANGSDAAEDFAAGTSPTLARLQPALFDLLGGESESAVRVVLGHFVLYVHPYLDGNGRMGRSS